MQGFPGSVEQLGGVGEALLPSDTTLCGRFPPEWRLVGHGLRKQECAALHSTARCGFPSRGTAPRWGRLGTSAARRLPGGPLLPQGPGANISTRAEWPVMRRGLNTARIKGWHGSSRAGPHAKESDK